MQQRNPPSPRLPDPGRRLRLAALLSEAAACARAECEAEPEDDNKKAASGQLAAAGKESVIWTPSLNLL